MTRALITGITGQDGSYLTEILLNKGYTVFGLVRRSSTLERTRLDSLRETLATANSQEKLQLVYGDLSDEISLRRAISDIRPDEVYNLGGQSHVRLSFEMPQQTADTNGLGTLRLLEAIRETNLQTKFYQASSSEIFGDAPAGSSCDIMHDETSAFHPRSPYAISKLFAYWTTINYREAYRLHAVNGILFNHESPRRGENFVTRKITLSAARIKCGLQHELTLGNLDARRDWGFARDYMEAAWLMLHHEHAEDFVIATGRAHSVREFLDEAFGYLDLDWREYVRVDEKYLRPTDPRVIIGNAAKAQRLLKWQPRTSFRDLVQMMVAADLSFVRANESKA